MVRRLSLESLTTISYWRYVKIKKCFGFGAFPYQLKPDIKDPGIKTKSLIVGLFYHDLLEKLNSCKAEDLKSATVFNDAFNNLLEKMKNELSSSVENRHLANLDKWGEIKQIYSSVFSSFSSGELENVKSGTLKAEESLQSKDGKITGKIDAYFVDGTYISLIDYKSSNFDGEVSNLEDYKRQLYLYAYLLQENFGVYPITLSLVDRNNNLIKIPPAPSLSIDIANEMRDLLGEYNSKISVDNSLYSNANPSVESCKFCKVKPFCKRFWEEKSIHSEIGEFNHIVIGKQVGEIKQSVKGGCVIRIEVAQSTIRSEEITVGRLFMARFPHLKDVPGQTLILTNLKNVSASTFSAEFTDQSIIYWGLDG